MKFPVTSQKSEVADKYLWSWIDSVYAYKEIHLSTSVQTVIHARNLYKLKVNSSTSERVKVISFILVS